MILSLAVALGLIASLARHRSRTVEQIAAISLRSAWLALLALVLQWPLLQTLSVPPEQLRLEQMLFLVSQLFLLAFVWRNRRLTGMWLVGLGILSNMAVIVANGGWMPIMPETLLRVNPDSILANWPRGWHYEFSKDLILLRQDTVLWMLSDILVLPPPFPWTAAFSPGDLIFAGGIVWLLQGPGAVPNPVGDESRTVGYPSKRITTVGDGIATSGSGSIRTGDKGGIHR
ncbi:MAG: DUF5317 domain-containing protein [Anaerolineae bacterium]|jgi:hypothetical protein